MFTESYHVGGNVLVVFVEGPLDVDLTGHLVDEEELLRVPRPSQLVAYHIVGLLIRNRQADVSLCEDSDKEQTGRRVTL